MTNFQLIANAAIGAGLYTMDEVVSILNEYGELPLHTFAEWKSRGFAVRKGEHAKLTTQIWKFKGRGKQTVEVSEDDDKNSRNFYLTKAFFFTADQVDKIVTV